MQAEDGREGASRHVSLSPAHFPSLLCLSQDHFLLLTHPLNWGVRTHLPARKIDGQNKGAIAVCYPRAVLDAVIAHVANNTALVGSDRATWPFDAQVNNDFLHVAKDSA